jgi:hypothetical protein
MGGSVSETARLLGMWPKTIYFRLCNVRFPSPGKIRIWNDCTHRRTCASPAASTILLLAGCFLMSSMTYRLSQPGMTSVCSEPRVPDHQEVERTQFTRCFH